MTTFSFLIVLVIFLLFLGLVIHDFIVNPDDNKSGLVLFLLIYVMVALIAVPFSAPSKQRIKEIPVVSSEYKVYEQEDGLMITYKDKYIFITDYKTIKTFNDSTNITYKEQRSFYGTLPQHYLIINDKQFTLKIK